MKFRHAVRLACTLLWAVPLTSLAASELDIVVNAKPAATIVIPDDPPKWTRQAADWLQEYIDKVSGARLPVLPEGKAPDGTLISVGHTRLFAKQRIELSGLRWDGCRLHAVRASLYIVGAWIRQPKELTMKPLLVMNKLETEALGGCSNITTPRRRR